MRSRAGNREIAEVHVPQALGYDREVRFTLPLGGTITIATTPMIVIPRTRLSASLANVSGAGSGIRNRT
jgi:hypothetical protein